MTTGPACGTLVELLEELAAWIEIPAPPEPASAARYAATLRARAQRIREAIERREWKRFEHAQVAAERELLDAINAPEVPHG